MRKRLYLMVLVVLLVMTMCSCSKPDDQSPPKANPIEDFEYQLSPIRNE